MEAAKNEPITSKQEKVNMICEQMRKVMSELNESKFLHPILCTYVRNEPHMLEEALFLINKVREQEKLKGSVSSESEAERALKYVIYLVDDVNALYDVALGTYNFDLVMMVAQKTQKDPKEYLPFLKKLSVMEESLRKYNIDIHLKRYKRALTNLSEAGENHFEECLSLIKNHRLYHHAIQIYQSQKEKLFPVYESFGHYLLSKNHYEEAALIYLRGEKFEQAIDCFRRAKNWKMAITLAKKQGYNNEKLAQLAKSIIEFLNTTPSQYYDASYLLLNYCNDPQKAFKCLVDGKLWEHALHLVKLLILLQKKILNKKKGIRKSNGRGH